MRASEEGATVGQYAIGADCASDVGGVGVIILVAIEVRRSSEEDAFVRQTTKVMESI